MGAGVGTSTISATVGAVSGSTTLTVTAATLASIDVEPVDPTIAKTTTQAFTATGFFTDGSSQDITTQVTWTSSSTSVATITSGGLATGVAAGTSTIKATLGAISGTSKLTVTSATVSSIAVTPAAQTIAKTTTRQFTATATFSDGSTQDISSLATWSSSNTAAATITSAGLATGVAAGTSTISATFGGKTGTTTLTVSSATLVSIAVTPSGSTIVKGYKLQYTATGTFSDGTTQNITTLVTWSSSATTVASISNAAGSNGLASGKGAGTTTIRATYQGKTGSATLTGVVATLQSIVVTPNPGSVAVGSTLSMIATGHFSGSVTMDITIQCSWKSSKSSTLSFKAKGLAFGKKPGSVTVTATNSGISGTATVSVN
jgi:hypothetical protein